MAQLNVATLRAPLDHPDSAGFAAGLAAINAIGEASEGFVWRLQDEGGDATAIQVFPDPLTIVNLTVWESVEALRRFTYRSEHASFLHRRAQWFTRDGSASCMWWIPAGTIPTTGDARRRQEFLDEFGPSPFSFGFSSLAAPLTFRRAGVTDADAIGLISELNAELDAAYPEPGANYFSLSDDDVAPGSGVLLVASLDGAAVASGAVRRIAQDTVEIKRMYTRPAARGQRIASAMLSELLEAAGGFAGVTRVVLETGPRLPEPIALYRRFGFTPCECWGEYAATPETSLCLSRKLG